MKIIVLLALRKKTNKMDSTIKYFLEISKNMTYQRDSSHNHIHMEKVMRNALNILKNLKEKELPQGNYNLIKKMIIATSLLHDIIDHKYIPEKEIKNTKEILLFFLNCEFKFEDSQLILNIIDNISYSKEKKFRDKYNTAPNWILILGNKGSFIRNIVSDADKLEALGEIGIKRCLEYSKIKREENNKPISEKLLKEDLIKHCEEKLFVLVSDYLIFDYSKELGRKSEIEMKKIIDLMD